MEDTQNIQNIDDLLTGAKSATQPHTPEYQPEIEYGDPIDEEDNSEISDQSMADDEPGRDGELHYQEETEEKENESSDLDEYGNKKDNEVIRGRLKQQAKKYETKIEQYENELQTLRLQLRQQGASQQVQQAAKDFEYDPNEEGSWQQQLEAVIKQTVKNMHQEDARAQEAAREEAVQAQFVKKFREDMQNFEDYQEVVGSQPIDNAMLMAARNMESPAAFLYAASKRAPEELARISKINDPYARIAEMGRLEERMRRHKQPTKAPRPVSRVQEDLTIPHKTDKKESIEDLIAKSEARKLAMIKQRTKAR